MATVHFPGDEVHRSKRFAPLAAVPFVLTGGEDYPEAINEYLYRRARGLLSHNPTDPLPLVNRPLERGSAASLARSLADLLTWAETEEAHPFLGEIHWRDIRAWHIQELYRDALTQGFWTAAFFSSHEPRPISPDVVKTRVSQGMSCYRWLHANNRLDRRINSTGFDDDPTLQIITRSKDDALLSFRREMRQLVVPASPAAPKNLRRAPADVPLPTFEHLARFFRAMPVPHRLGAMLLFETGMRAEEVIENTLLPGESHLRNHDPSKGWYVHSGWPTTPYALKYSLDDNRMIGVLPTREMAWWSDRRLGYQCDYRILGKGRKIRKVHVPPNLLKRIWKYVDSDERNALVRERMRRGGGRAAHLLLNRFGEALSYHALWEAFDAANKILKAPRAISPHDLRHAYACYFLEAHILEEATRQGFNFSNIPSELIMKVGNTALLIIQQELGHTEFGTTRRYLSRLAEGRIRFAAIETWSRHLDSLNQDE